MKGSFKFFRTHKGISSFAIVELSTNPTEDWHLVWVERALELQPVYNDAVEKALSIVSTEHEKRAGKPQTVTILSITETVVDTKDDAVTCATAMALWLSLGYSATEMSFVHNSNQWAIRF
jgi:hypothetical protein